MCKRCASSDEGVCPLPRRTRRDVLTASYPVPSTSLDQFHATAFRTVLTAQGRQRLEAIDYNPLLILEGQYHSPRTTQGDTPLMRIFDEVGSSYMS